MRFQLKFGQVVSMGMIGVLLAVAVAAAFSHTASAGTNGQMISFVGGYGVKFTYLKVTGQNQKGQEVSWEKKFTSPGVNSWIIAGWWWKNRVTIEFDVPGKGRLACTSNIPTDQGKLDYNLVVYRGARTGCTTESEVESFDQTVSLAIKDYILAKSTLQNVDRMDDAIDKNIDGLLLDYEPACYLAILAAVPVNARPIPLEPEIIAVCEKEIRSAETVFKLFKTPLPLRKSSSW